MTTTPAPRRIEWAGPESSVVFADEDGVHLRLGSVSMEQPDVERLFAIWSAARAAATAGEVPAPRPITREESREHGRDNLERYAAKKAIRAVEAAFRNDPTPPF